MLDRCSQPCFHFVLSFGFKMFIGLFHSMLGKVFQWSVRVCFFVKWVACVMKIFSFVFNFYLKCVQIWLLNTWYCWFWLYIFLLKNQWCKVNCRRVFFFLLKFCFYSSVINTWGLNNNCVFWCSLFVVVYYSCTIFLWCCLCVGALRGKKNLEPHSLTAVGTAIDN